MRTLGLVLFFLWYSPLILTSAYSYSRKLGYVITTESNDRDQQINFEGGTTPKIYEMQIESNISNRYAHTLITSKVQNWNSVAREATFSVILPNKAYISEFVMVIGGRSYKAYVKEKQEARNIYDQAVAKGLGAAHVAVTARESNRFTVSVNVEALSKATFLLRYEELLRLKDNQYELVINIHPNQPVNDLFVNVFINESRPLRFIKTAPLRSGNEVSKREGDLDPRASIFQFNTTSALVQFKPNVERQKVFAGYLGTDTSKGLSGQFVVQYDVERDPQGGEVLVQDGYFVHFFAPSELQPFNKFVIFVLDTSGSMFGQKIEQLKQAMVAILEQLDSNDYFHIVEFETNTKIWNVLDSGNSCSTHKQHGFYRDSQRICHDSYPSAASGHSDNIRKAKSIISELRPGGGTNIYEALQTAMNLIDSEKKSKRHTYLPQPIIMFLTDGDPTVGIINKDRIITDITNKNEEEAPIYSLSFGEDADKDFLKRLSQNNQGFTRHIYEASDAALQLQNFYKEIASPLLSGVTFEYVPNAISLTKTKFPLHFGGSEIVVAGKLHTSTFPEIPRVICTSKTGPLTLQPIIERPVTSLERLWAYLTIQQLLDDDEVAQNKASNERKALDLALRYSFVTPVSSLVVVKPNSIETDIETEAADFSLTAPPGITPLTPVFANNYPKPYADADLDSKISSSRSFPGLNFNLMSASHPKFNQRFNTEQHEKSEHDISPVLSITGKKGDAADNNQDSLTKKLNDLKSALPWLENCLNENGTLKSPPGGYQLGLNRTLFYKNGCTETPTHTTGLCELLHECPQVHHLLTSEDVFIRYFCPIKKRYGKFAGVCCP